ncbi:meiosis-specific protein ASY1-like [Papaver somniferum]|uniref:meiosis-specific protein ASY1-like n=1 Tax=Papaver somniferum TaxID=3469 RepID=UPI000E6FC117|nr:meiosis-specific protein ASY1-like [Papaver somniferum]
MADQEDDTHDAEEDEHQLKRVRDWISSSHIDNIELTDVLSSFPDISVALTEEIMDKLVNQNILSRTGKDSYSISKMKAIVVKEEIQVNQVDEKVQRGNDEDYLYLKALYHVLPLDYVTISKLQSKLEGEANQATARELLDKMACDGYVEAKNKPRLGKRVIRSELTDKKLFEVKNVLEIKLSAMEISEPQNISTCGGLHSVGSDLTRTRERSVDTQQNGSSRIQEQLGNNTPIRGNERQGRVVYQGSISEMVWMGEDSVTVVRVIIPSVVVPVRKSAPGKLAR